MLVDMFQKVSAEGAAKKILLKIKLYEFGESCVLQSFDTYCCLLFHGLHVNIFLSQLAMHDCCTCFPRMMRKQRTLAAAAKDEGAAP